jgi:hypothetical protein
VQSVSQETPKNHFYGCYRMNLVMICPPGIWLVHSLLIQIPCWTVPYKCATCFGRMLVRQGDRIHVNVQHRHQDVRRGRLPISIYVQSRFQLRNQASITIAFPIVILKASITIASDVGRMLASEAAWLRNCGRVERAVCCNFRRVTAKMEGWARSSLLDFIAEMACCLAHGCRFTGECNQKLNFHT